MLAGKLQGRNRFRVNTHARTDAVATAGEAAAQYPATRGLTSTQILAMVREHGAAVGDVAEPLPAALRVAEALPDRPAALAAAHLGDREAGGSENFGGGAAACAGADHDHVGLEIEITLLRRGVDDAPSAIDACAKRIRERRAHVRF